MLNTADGENEIGIFVQTQHVMISVLVYMSCTLHRKDKCSFVIINEIFLANMLAIPLYSIV